MRPVMSQDKLAGVLATLRAVPRRLSKDFKKRQGRIREKLATARPIKIAETIRDLTWRRHQKHLTKVDKELLERGRNFLAAEMAMVTDTDEVYVHQELDAVLKAAIKGEQDESERESVVATGQELVRDNLVQEVLKRVARDDR
jgi:RNA polymerase-interacting CarD/CdnL/TRCF family regulator